MRRLLWIVPLVALVGAAGYSAWLALQVKGDLEAAAAAADELRTTLTEDDRAARERGIEDLRVAASRAHDRTDGAWWGAMTHLPLVGDDAEGIRALSTSLDTLATDGLSPLTDTLDQLDDLAVEGGVDLRVLERLTPQVAEARAAVAEAAAAVEGRDSSGYAGSVRSRFEEYVDLVTDADATLASAEKATEVLPTMLGSEGPRDYLMVFQNNAEIRASGGLPGSWALMHAEDGTLSMTQQGTAGAFPKKDQPVLPLSGPEEKVYYEHLGEYFQDANFTPDFPRTAELMDAHWQQSFPETELDGVFSLDPVAMSYLLEGTGPVEAAPGLTLTPENTVEELLNRPYLELEPAAQDALFAAAARGIFEAMTGDLEDPVGFVQGLSRAAAEGRFLVATFDEAERETLAGSEVLGALPEDNGRTPYVDIALNDGTGSKMSYYLRYDAQVRATSCADGRQVLSGSLRLRQAIAASEAVKLPESVTGPGDYGIKRGEQLVYVRILGPHGGDVTDVRVDGKAVRAKPVVVDGRPTSTLFIFLKGMDDVVVNWTMPTGPGQTADGELGMTPGIIRGDNDDRIGTAC